MLWSKFCDPTDISGPFLLEAGIFEKMNLDLYNQTRHIINSNHQIMDICCKRAKILWRENKKRFVVDCSHETLTFFQTRLS